MKSKCIVLLFTFLSVLNCASLFASTGTVSFLGSITDSTCDFNGGNGDLNVDMGTISASEFTGLGTVSAKKPFALEFANCSSGVNDISVRFNGDSSGLGVVSIEPGDDSAQGVAITLMDENGNVIFLNESETKKYPVISGSANIPLYAAYYEIRDPVSPGKANGSMIFSVIYN